MVVRRAGCRCSVLERSLQVVWQAAASIGHTGSFTFASWIPCLAPSSTPYTHASARRLCVLSHSRVCHVRPACAELPAPRNAVCASLSVSAPRPGHMRLQESSQHGRGVAMQPQWRVLRAVRQCCDFPMPRARQHWSSLVCTCASLLHACCSGPAEHNFVVYAAHNLFRCVSLI